ncbi:MAG TPA: SigB/SigF/SigG family RNA polymerase sigma factor [Solirubrobacterales bacterium]
MTAATIEIRPAGLEKVHEAALWKRFQSRRDQDAREELIALYLPMARRMAGRYSGVVEPYDDLLQVASIGLLNAVDRFDPGRDIPFAAFAKPTIMGELKRYFRDKVWTIRVPRAIHDRMARIEAATEEFSRPPSPKEVAARLQIDVTEVLEALEAQQNRRPLGLEAPIGGEEGDLSTPEWLGKSDDSYELIEDRMTLERVLPGLDEREQKVLRMRFVEELPQTRIAAEIGCSQMHVSRLLRSILKRLREEAESEEQRIEEAAR